MRKVVPLLLASLHQAPLFLTSVCFLTPSNDQHFHRVLRVIPGFSIALLVLDQGLHRFDFSTCFHVATQFHTSDRPLSGVGNAQFCILSPGTVLLNHFPSLSLLMCRTLFPACKSESRVTAGFRASRLPPLQYSKYPVS